MALSIDIEHPEWLAGEARRERLLAYSPHADTRVAAEPGRPGKIEMLTVSTYHPRVQLTPQVSGYHLGDAIGDIAENYRRLRSGEPLPHLVDRERGY